MTENPSTLSSLSRKIAFNTTFISLGGLGLSVKYEQIYFCVLRRIIRPRRDQIPVLSEITKAIIALGKLPAELFPAGWGR